MLVAARTHDYGKQPIDALAVLLKSEGIEAAQLVLPKAFSEINSYDEVTPKLVERIRQNFEEAGIKIHILGCYMDLGNPNDEVRRAAVETFRKCLAWNQILGASIVGTETAYPHLSCEEKRIWYPYMLDSIARLAEEAERLNVDMAIEPVYWHPLESLETTAAVFEKINSARLKMIFDPANVLEFPEINQEKYWKEWLDILGDKIEAIHMKDFIEGPHKEYCPVCLGEGVVRYSEIIQWMNKNKSDIVAVREELNPKTAQKDILYMKDLWKRYP
ncbi:sugar phosphate isomerase/epimerase family protein [Cellulosilyticum sp. I15G10I2]|uniref:sugar phosphate isomerase/epimerase family protein n=1 Tax=Cellulosilyticum sp. I15G10I2 TaxID=1892843 RepID=UPI00085BCC84|nr:sugar phosphate isomerase/epimerase family protein [Cellulosilyticum sp. I15G10I2]